MVTLCAFFLFFLQSNRSTMGKQTNNIISELSIKERILRWCRQMSKCILFAFSFCLHHTDKNLTGNTHTLYAKFTHSYINWIDLRIAEHMHFVFTFLENHLSSFSPIRKHLIFYCYFVYIVFHIDWIWTLTVSISFFFFFLLFFSYYKIEVVLFIRFSAAFLFSVFLHFQFLSTLLFRCCVSIAIGWYRSWAKGIKIYLEALMNVKQRKKKEVGKMKENERRKPRKRWYWNKINNV